METVAIKTQKPGDLVSREVINAIVEAIVKNFEPVQIILFGSYATDSPSPDSDLDLLVVAESELPLYKRATPLHLLFKPHPCAMDILVYTPKEVARWRDAPNHIISEAIRSGVVVYEK